MKITAEDIEVLEDANASIRADAWNSDSKYFQEKGLKLSDQLEEIISRMKEALEDKGHDSPEGMPYGCQKDYLGDRHI